MAFTWTDEQLDIFDAFADPEAPHMAVKARAGSAKTTTSVEGTRRFSYRRSGRGLVAAFNKRIAVELEDKVAEPTVAKTLNSLGYGFCRKKIRGIGTERRRGTILAGKARRQLAAEWRKSASATAQKNVYSIGKWETTKLVRDLATITKQVRPFATDPEEVEEVAVAYQIRPDVSLLERGVTDRALAEMALRAVELAITEHDGKVDFADQIFLPVRMRWAFPAFQLVVIDEAQDLSPVQVELLQRSVEPSGRLVFVFDPAQCIYQFRGASEEFLEDLVERYECERFALTTSFRCAQRIAEEARKTVSDIFSREGAPEGIVRSVLGNDAVSDHARPGDFVLAKENEPLGEIWTALNREGVPAYILGRGERGTMLALLERGQERAKSERVDSVVTALSDLAQEEKRLAEADPTRADFAEELAGRVGMLSDLTSALYRSAGVRELEGLVREAFPDEEGIDPSKVVISTIHKVKGLEADRVFLLRKGLGEASNLRYVGVTRARDELVWVEEA